MGNKGWKRGAAALALCLALTGCGAGEPAWQESSEENGALTGTGAEESPGEGGISAGTGAEDNAGEKGNSEENGLPAGTGADGQEEESDMNGEYETYFQDMKLTESYKGPGDANPLMTQRFGADPYAMEYDGRVYFYMTADAFEYQGDEVQENTYGKIHSINVISTADMANFTDHGSIEVGGSGGAARWANNSWAPAAAWKNIDGQDKFFLYFADGGGGIGVLTADSPTGPFTDPLGHGLVTRQTPTCAEVLWLFDPAVLVDDDGRAYLYFGGGVPEGKAAAPGTARVVELGEDMISLKGDPRPIDVPYLFEDSGIHKYNNKYYYTYCTNWQVDAEGTATYGFHNAEIASLESDSPMGPFTFKEVILENPGKLNGLYGNNHHCVFSFKDNWYIAYHARTLEKNMGVEKGYRCTHVDSFVMGEDGTIGRIPLTVRGRQQLGTLDPYREISAVTMAMQGGLDTVALDNGGRMALSSIDSGDFFKVQGVDLGDTAPRALRITARCGEKTTGLIQVRLDSPQGQALGYVPLGAAQGDGEGFAVYEAELDREITGVHDLYFVFYCGEGDSYELSGWQFVKAGEDLIARRTQE